VLVATGRCWFSAARLAMALAEAGCQVEMVCPFDHPASLTRAVSRYYAFSTLCPVRSLHVAIRKSVPDFVVAADDVVAIGLHHLYFKTAHLDDVESLHIRNLLRKSLGDPASFSTVSSKTRFLTMAREEGIPALPTEDVPTEDALRDWLSRHDVPVVLKADGTSGGEGVKIAHSQKSAIRAWRSLRAPVGIMRVMKQAVVARNLGHVIPWITRRQRTVSAQPFLHGYDLNIAASCWKGELLGAVCMEVLHPWRPNGPAALLRLSNNEEVMEAARAMIRRLGLSGLCGFDFMVEYKTGRTYLIEINARATQTCHLPLGIPRNPVPSLVAAMAGKPMIDPNPATRSETVALFPLAWQSGISKEILDSTYRDIPWEEPRLVKAGFAESEQSFYEKGVRILGRVRMLRAAAGKVDA
jgi:hypothetical protein